MQDVAGKSTLLDAKAVPSAVQEAMPPMESNQQTNDDVMTLREHLLAAQTQPSQYPPQEQHTHSQQPPQHPHGAETPDSLRHGGTPIPHLHQRSPQQQLPPGFEHDPNAVPQQGSGYGMPPMDEDMQDPDMNSPDAKRGGKRELSTSKRAAQNRAAQRAFRQRKEGYIKKLEEENRDMKVALDQGYGTAQAENYQLRDYVIQLQNRLQETSGSYPPPASNLQLRDPRTGEPLHQMSAEQPMAPGAVTQLQQASAYDQRAPTPAYPPPPNGHSEQHLQEVAPTPAMTSDPLIQSGMT